MDLKEICRIVSFGSRYRDQDHVLVNKVITFGFHKGVNFQESFCPLGLVTRKAVVMVIR
jgi:hypothetical protein